MPISFRTRSATLPFASFSRARNSSSEKGSASAAYWLPTNADYRCDYVARQIGVKDKYQLTVTSQEKDAMLAVLHTCPGQAVPADE